MTAEEDAKYRRSFDIDWLRSLKDLPDCILDDKRSRKTLRRALIGLFYEYDTQGFTLESPLYKAAPDLLAALKKMLGKVRQLDIPEEECVDLEMIACEVIQKVDGKRIAQDGYTDDTDAVQRRLDDGDALG